MHRLILGCILASILGGAIAVAQSPVTSTKPLTTPGMNQPLLVPPPTTSKNSPSPAGSGLGLGVQIVPGVSPVTNPQASKGGSDAEKIHKAETRVTVRGFDKVDRLTRGGKSSEEAKGKSTEQKVWLPSNFKPNLPGADRPAKVDAVTTKRSTKPDELGSARDYAKPPAKSGAGGQDKSKFGTWGPGYTPDKSSTDKSKFGTWGPGFTPDKSSKDGQYGTWGPGYTPETDNSSNDKSKYGTYGPGYTPDNSSNDKSKYGTYGPGYTPHKSSKDGSKKQPEYEGWYIDSIPVGEASGGTGTKTGASTGTGTGTGGSTGGKSQMESQNDKQSQSSEKPSQ
jgi:hypothetical protein